MVTQKISGYVPDRREHIIAKYERRIAIEEENKKLMISRIVVFFLLIASVAGFFLLLSNI